MKFTVGTLTRCAGQGHIDIPCTVTEPAQFAGMVVVLKVNAGDLDLERPTLEELKDLMLQRCVSAKKEANASSFAQVRTALEGKTLAI
jgi:hypothetical protein